MIEYAFYIIIALFLALIGLVVGVLVLYIRKILHV